MPPSLARVKPVQQKRSEEMRDRLLEALGSAVDAGEIEAMSVHDIAARAGASVGAFYGRFADKDAALAALLARRRADFVAEFLEKSRAAASLDGWARMASALALEHARRNRALLARLEATSLFAEGRIAELTVVDRLATLFRDRFGMKLSAPTDVAFALAFIGAMARDAAVHSEGLIASSKTRDWFVEETARAVTAYLVRR